jgi:hypothetical protein
MNRMKSFTYKGEKFYYWFKPKWPEHGWYWNHENGLKFKPSGPFRYENIVRTAIREFVDNMED